jgi:hypothetical protein
MTMDKPRWSKELVFFLPSSLSDFRSLFKQIAFCKEELLFVLSSLLSEYKNFW